jgi:membrane associated rhomboid family serine protease
MLFPLYVLNPRLRFPLVTLLIISANLLVMGWLIQVREIDQSKIAAEYGFVPARLTFLGSGKRVNVPVQTLKNFGMPGIQLVTQVSTDARDVYRSFFSMMFLHGGWMHLLMNMWMLWLFGPNIEDRLGHLVFAMFYALGGVMAMLAFWLSDPAGHMPVIGASGAVAAVLGAYAVTFPSAKVRTLLFFFFILIVDMPALLLLGVWFLLQVFSGMLGLWGIAMEPVAFWAHVGGFVAGMILMPLLSFGASPPGADWRKETDDMFRFDEPQWTRRID